MELYLITASAMKNTVFNFRLKLLAKQKPDLFLEKFKTFRSSNSSKVYNFYLKFRKYSP